jgi:hypothetical protein
VIQFKDVFVIKGGKRQIQDVTLALMDFMDHDVHLVLHVSMAHALAVVLILELVSVFV